MSIPRRLVMTGLLIIVVVGAAIGGLLAYRRSLVVRSVDAKAGGLYSVVAGEGKYALAKVLLIEAGVVHVRLYQGRSQERAISVDPRLLRLGRFDEPDPGMGHLPISPRVFASWKPQPLAVVKVEDDELDGYNEWKRAGGGTWDG